MPTIEDLELEIKQLKEENLKLKDDINNYRSPGAVGLYYELNRLVNDTVAFTRSNTIKALLASEDEKSKKFERIMVLIKNAKEHVLDMEDIKIKLGLTGNKDKDNKEIPFIETFATKRD